MQSCIKALAVLLLLTLLVAGNAVYVRQVSSDMLAALDALPAAPDPTETPDRIAAIRTQWEKDAAALSLSVNYNIPDRVTEALAMLEAYARTEEGSQYAAQRAALRDLLSDVTRLERLSWENIF